MAAALFLMYAETWAIERRRTGPAPMLAQQCHDQRCNSDKQPLRHGRPDHRPALILSAEWPKEALHARRKQPTEALRHDAVRESRKRWLLLVAGSFALIGIAYGVYWTLALRYVQSTDDAYVSGNVVQITPQISGTVIAIGADDTQFVKAGQTLVQLDQADARVCVARRGPERSLAQPVREVRSMFATSSQLQATVGHAQNRGSVIAPDGDPTRRERLAAFRRGVGAKSAAGHARGRVQHRASRFARWCAMEDFW